MTERGVLLFLASGSLVCIGGLVLAFVVGVRPRSIAFRFSGAALSLVIVVLSAPVFIELQIAADRHAAADSEGGTFFFGMLAELTLLFGFLALLGASLLWSLGIRRHPEPVPRLERAAQKATLAAPLAFLALWAARCFQGLVYAAP